MIEIFSYDITPDNNNKPAPDGWPENMEYSMVNDCGREMMAVIARFIKGSLSDTIQTSGTEPAYTLTTGFTLAAYAAGQMFAFKAHATSTGLVTLNCNGLGAGTVYDSSGVQLGAGDIVLGGVYLVVRTSLGFQRVGGTVAGVTSAQVDAAAIRWRRCPTSSAMPYSRCMNSCRRPWHWLQPRRSPPFRSAARGWPIARPSLPSRNAAMRAIPCTTLQKRF